MSNIDSLKKYHSGKSFQRYLKSKGVQEYTYFAHLPNDYSPSMADAAMALFESIGKKQCLDTYGITTDVGGNVFVDGENIGKSEFSRGKSSKDLSIQLWLEDVGTFGFSTSMLRRDMDDVLWDGWFDENVTPLIDKKLLEYNRSKECKEFGDKAFVSQVLSNMKKDDQKVEIKNVVVKHGLLERIKIIVKKIVGKWMTKS
jgi:hypothetical protein